MKHTHITSLRRAATGAAVVLAGMVAATTPALAATTDGTSNTIQVAVTSVTIDQAHNRVVVTVPSPGGLTPGMHLGRVQVSTPRQTLLLENTMISGYVVGPSSSAVTLTFCKVEYPVKPSDGLVGPEPLRSGVDAYLMEQDGIYAAAPADASASWDMQQPVS